VAKAARRTRMPAGWSAPPERLRLHIQNVAPMDLVYKVTPERYAAAAGRHPELAARIDVTVSEDAEDYARLVADADILVGWRFPHAETARLAPRLKWIHMTGAGIEHVMPLDWLPPGTVLTNNRGVHAPKAEQFAMTALLMLNERIPETITEQRAGRWRRHYATAIQGKTVLIVGVGNMGVAAAKAARKLRLRVLGIRRSGKTHRLVHEMATPDRLHEMMARADFVLVAAPLTLETEGLIDAAALDCLKPEAGLINMGRARIVDYAALQVRLADGRLRGAVLDVFDPEPLPADSPLWSAPNVILTPHVSSDDDDNYAPLTIDLVFDNIARWYAGKPLRNVVDRGLRY
jgi:glyoxylate/hydroxypyruvate reductase A